MMDNNLFNIILCQRIDTIKSTLKRKADEYAQDEDRLYNFKVAARMDDTTPENICWEFLLKHLVCVHDLAKGKLEAAPEIIDEKIGDAINYLILLEALLKEKTNG